MPCIYLAGPMAGCTDEECIVWREAAKKLWPGTTLDPMVRDYRSKDDESYQFKTTGKEKLIVEGDKQDIRNSDGIIVYFDRPSAGTSMEIIYAWERGIPVVVVDASKGQMSPWVVYHSEAVCPTIEEALTRLAAEVKIKPADRLASRLDSDSSLTNFVSQKPAAPKVKR